ncbi:MAG: hypothetical protein SWO11_06945 [Thermodesulfobacteriota bacterium]|nr:hypothetical protein [Thermodesulfobacteriota bacterium]
MAIQVPNIDSVLFRVFGQHYSMIQAQYHLYHFSPSTLRKFLTEHGFSLYRAVYSPSINGIALSIKNQWLNTQMMSLGKLGKYTGLLSTSGNADGGVVTWFRRKVALPMLRPIGRLLALIGHGDVFSMYARKV